MTRNAGREITKTRKGEVAKERLTVKIMRGLGLAAAVAILLCGAAFAQGKLQLVDRWVYLQTNLLVDKNVDALTDVFARASKARYNGVVLTDSKFSRLADMGQPYFRNVERVKKLAADTKIEVIPGVFSIGYSGDILSQDPNLAEGLPVREALFVVKNGEARLQPDPPVALKAGDMSDLSRWDFKDPTVTQDSGAARATNPNGQNARIFQRVRVSPFRQYHISVRVKTIEFLGTPEIKVLAQGKSLCFTDIGVKRTQDWTLHHVVFNSLGNEEVIVYFGCWDGRTGSLWWDDAKLEEVGLLNVVRRPGAPLAARIEGGRTLVEGKDFSLVNDPRMGSVPYKGSYEVWHEPPAIKTSLPDGTRLRVSFYHMVTVNQDQVMICPSEPKTVEVLRDEARRVHQLWGAKTYFMMHDEIRVLGWDESCVKRNLTPGAILADNVKTCAKILRETAPGCRVLVWSDMFDPNHSAHKDYYLVNGDLAGSWQGLDKGIVIAVWYFDKREASMRFFSGLGNKMLIAGYYDSDPARSALECAMSPRLA